MTNTLDDLGAGWECPPLGPAPVLDIPAADAITLDDLAERYRPTEDLVTPGGKGRKPPRWGIPTAAAETLLGLAAAAGDQVEEKQLREVARALAVYAERLWVYHSYGQPLVLDGPNDVAFVDEIEGLWAQVPNIGDLPAPVPPNFPTPDFAL